MSALARAARLVAFAGYFARELTVAGLQVAWDVLTPGSRLTAGIVELRLRSRTPAEITAIANLYSLTPGTLTLAVGRDPDTVYVHGMYAGDRDAFVRSLQEMEDRMLHALHGPESEARRPARRAGGRAG